MNPICIKVVVRKVKTQMGFEKKKYYYAVFMLISAFNYSICSIGLLSF